MRPTDVRRPEELREEACRLLAEAEVLDAVTDGSIVDSVLGRAWPRTPSWFEFVRDGLGDAELPAVAREWIARLQVADVAPTISLLLTPTAGWRLGKYVAWEDVQRLLARPAAQAEQDRKDP